MATNMPVCPMPSPAPGMPDPKLALQQANTVVLYDADSGTIAHVFQSATLVGAVAPTPAQMETTARAIYARMQPAASRNVAALHLNGFARDMMCPGTTYKVVSCALVPG